MSPGCQNWQKALAIGGDCDEPFSGVRALSVLLDFSSLPWGRRCFFANAISYIAVIIGLLFMRIKLSVSSRKIMAGTE